MAFASKNPCALTIVQTCIVMLIFCLAGCAAGSCLSYGHSCWGAHGKRSDFQGAPTTRIQLAKALSSGSPQRDIAFSPKEWILSRLITGHTVLPLMDKYRVRRTGLSKGNTIPFNNENGNNERKISNTQGVMHSTWHSMHEKPENAPEDLLISPVEYEKPINDPQKLNIFNFLNEGDGDSK